MNIFSIEETKRVLGAKMKVIGVGGGGCNMINHMIREGYNKIDLIVANTDAQALEQSLAGTKIQLGNGLGCGMQPELGRKAAEESYDELRDALDYSDMVFIAAGMGGGTGTGAAPIVARAAKEKKALTIGVVSTPYSFEGKKRFALALDGIEELKKECDSIIVIPNEKLLSLIDNKAGIKESFKIVDDVLARAVNGMSYVILNTGDSDINVDFADVQKVMSHRGLALMGVGVSEGEDAAKDAVLDAMQSPILDEIKIDGAKGVLMHFRMHPSHPFLEIAGAANLVRDIVDDYADVIFGTTTDESIENNRVEVTLIATGFEKPEKKEEPKKDETPSQFESGILARRKLKVSGGVDFSDAYDNLEIPSYLRDKMD